MNPKITVDSFDKGWLIAKGYFDERRYADAQVVYRELVDQYLTNVPPRLVIECWLKVIYCLVMLNEVDKSKEYIGKYEELIKEDF